MKSNLVVLLTDFGLRDRFVASMKGVICTIDPSIRIFDLSHDIEPFNILEASSTLADTLLYWPKETVFVAVIDPGVGTKRKSLIAWLKSGHSVICPDNGLLTQIDTEIGIESIFEIDEVSQRLPGSEKYQTFHGRDIYAYNAARLASGQWDLGNYRKFDGTIIKLNIKPAKLAGIQVTGTIIKIERPFGNLCTNIPATMLSSLGESENFSVSVFECNALQFSQTIPFTSSFDFVRH